MARGMFSRFKAELLRKTIDQTLAGDNGLKAYAFDAGAHTVNFDVDQFISDIPVGALEGTAVTMTNVTVSDDGEVDFDDFAFASISGDSVEAVLYTLQHTALADELLVYYDDDADFVPDGNNVNITYSSYVFKL